VGLYSEPEFSECGHDVALAFGSTGFTDEIDDELCADGGNWDRKFARIRVARQKPELTLTGVPDKFLGVDRERELSKVRDVRDIRA
jgi:hypothetical protein